MEFAFLAVAAFLAGLIDAVAGGGGLVQIPALFSAFPGMPPATLLGTNKVASVAGTANAAIRYGRSVRIYWAATAPAVVAAFLFSMAGAWALTMIPAEPLRKALPFVLVTLLVYTVAKKDLGTEHAPSLSGTRERVAALLAGAAIGFYDGVFGPGTGSFLMIVFVRVFGYDFLHASASTKVVNMATNLAALLLLASKGHIWWQLGLVMAVANVAGSQVGSRLALRHGSGFVRKVFIVVVSALILKTAWDAFAR
ncbi:putative membrane transporter protein YfcA [Cupriavidus yeoncheonensis]|uniref:Probable membrane transporter protein n=1 Tax=Cupriavidus yeoncheonensis TaxID=1462994 RepID=A0A916N2W8_9BURK|nr:TSUP family transporter [Cupriavidus yeoncheonensis]CAG2132698.1 putative membrane transporter protein YfcA [Cupriavidus yeoncheonensis]